MASMPDTQPLHERVLEALAGIDDPEMPISILDLGIIVDVRVDGGHVHIRLTPTFTGCPALEMINQSIREQLNSFPDIENVTIEQVFDPPWSAERITEAGRRRLQEHGVTVPARSYVQLQSADRELVHCPFCHSTDTRLDSPFGPTRCRVIYYCQACHNPFEHIKAV